MKMRITAAIIIFCAFAPWCSAEPEKDEGGLHNQVVGISAQVGIIDVDDASGKSHARAVYGVTSDFNFLAHANTGRGRPFFGPAAGFFYSHLGQSGANFFGVNSPGGVKGADIFLIPLNLKVGYTFGNAYRISGRLGANIIYQNNPASARQAVPGTFIDEDWDASTNLGADVEIGLSRNVSLVLRPDWIFRPGAITFSGTAGLQYPLK